MPRGGWFSNQWLRRVPSFAIITSLSKLYTVQCSCIGLLASDRFCNYFLQHFFFNRGNQFNSEWSFFQQNLFDAPESACWNRICLQKQNRFDESVWWNRICFVKQNWFLETESFFKTESVLWNRINLVQQNVFVETEKAWWNVISFGKQNRFEESVWGNRMRHRHYAKWHYAEQHKPKRFNLERHKSECDIIPNDIILNTT